MASSSGVPSRARLFGHPIHPMLIPFPIAFLLGALATDLAFWGTGDSFWARASLWLVGSGLLTGVLAALAGLTDFLTIGAVRRLTAAWVHFLGNATVLLLSAVSLALRRDDPVAALLPWGLVLSAMVAGLLGVTGWMGGELAYRHGIGMIRGEGDDRLAEPPSQSRDQEQARLRRT